jgi:multiple sugar transport system permease protein
MPGSSRPVFGGMMSTAALNKTSALDQGKTKTLLIFLSPWIVSLIVFWYGPIIYTLVLSFTKYKLVGDASFIGIKNYIDIVHDSNFWHGLYTTFLFTSLYVPLNIVMGLFTAFILDLDVKPLALWRALIFLPAVLPVIAIFVIGKFIFYPNGLLNNFLQVFGIKGPLWIANPDLIIIASVLLMVWQCGTAMVVYLGALQGVPKHYYDAAEIDGIGKLGQFRHITLPLISPSILFRAILDLKLGLMIFIPALVLPEGNVPGGPADASRFYTLHVYQKAFQRFNIGEASALAMVLIVISLILTIVVMRTSRRVVFYEV